MSASLYPRESSRFHFTSIISFSWEDWCPVKYLLAPPVPTGAWRTWTNDSWNDSFILSRNGIDKSTRTQYSLKEHAIDNASRQKPLDRRRHVCASCHDCPLNWRWTGGRATGSGCPCWAVGAFGCSLHVLNGSWLGSLKRPSRRHGRTLGWTKDWNVFHGPIGDPPL